MPEITIIQRNAQLIPREDEDVALAVRAILEDEGIRILTSAEVRRVEAREGRLAVVLSTAG